VTAYRITIERTEDLAPEDRAALHAFLTGIFQPSADDVFAETQHCVRVRVDDAWVSVVEVLEHVIEVGGRGVRIAGIGGVSTAPEHRGRGYATAALEAAARFAFDDLRVEIGMLFCDERMVPFYERLGWRLVERRCRCVGRGHREAFEERFMILAPDGTELPEGEIDLRGPLW